jgi:prevent-host-death family protein
MQTKTVDVQEAQANLTELLSLVAAGTEIILTEDNTPLARLVPMTSPAQPRVAGLHRGATWTSDDFDEPLPDEFWTGTQ